VWNIHILKDIISLSFMLIVLDQESSCLFCQLSHRNPALQDCSVICPVTPSSFIQTPSCGDRGPYLTHGSVSRTSPHSRTASRSGLAKICRDSRRLDTGMTPGQQCNAYVTSCTLDDQRDRALPWPADHLTLIIMTTRGLWPI